MDYFLQFHWWYLLIGFFLLIAFTGKSKGGVVANSLRADLKILDNRFDGCKPKADYSIFKKDKPDHIDIEIERLTIPVGDELEFHLNGKLLAKVEVKPNKEAEFDNWDDENLSFPKINEGDKLVIKYQGKDVLSGVFYND